MNKACKSYVTQFQAFWIQEEKKQAWMMEIDEEMTMWNARTIGMVYWLKAPTNQSIQASGQPTIGALTRLLWQRTINPVTAKLTCTIRTRHPIELACVSCTETLAPAWHDIYRFYLIG